MSGSNTCSKTMEMLYWLEGKICDDDDDGGGYISSGE